MRNRGMIGRVRDSLRLAGADVTHRRQAVKAHLIVTAEDWSGILRVRRHGTPLKPEQRESDAREGEVFEVVWHPEDATRMAVVQKPSTRDADGLDAPGALDVRCRTRDLRRGGSRGLGGAILAVLGPARTRGGRR